ncbi:MAG: hypothetical protein J1E32_08755, partial [Treponema sp.]|nr:hypothetical protein [Treponema sp.]
SRFAGVISSAPHGHSSLPVKKNLARVPPGCRIFPAGMQKRGFYAILFLLIFVLRGFPQKRSLYAVFFPY